MSTSTKTFRYLIVAVAFAAFLYIAGFVNADTVYGYTTPEYDVDIHANINQTFDYRERITVDFGEEAHHGIYRYIPLGSKYRIKDIKVNNYEYDTYAESGNQVIKVGSADTTLKGRQTYIIRYTIQGIQDNDSKADYLNLDGIPGGWETPIDKAKVTIHLPKDFEFTSLQYYSGTYGSTINKYGTWKKDGPTIVYEAENLPKSAGASVYGVLPEGSWTGSLSYGWVKNLLLILVLAGTLIMVLLRITWGRNPEITETVEFYPPEGLTPIDVGYIIDGTVDDSDMTATFFYLADKGYIDIDEYKKNKFKFTRLGDLPESEKPSIQRFFRGIFGSSAFKDYETLKEKEPKKLTVRTKEIGDRMHHAFEDIPSLVDDEYSGGHKLFTAKSRKADRIGKMIFFLVPALATALLMFLNTTLSLLYSTATGLVVGLFFLALTRKLVSIYYYRKSRKGSSVALKFALWVTIYAFAVLGYMQFFCLDPEWGYNDGRITTILLAFFVIGPLVLLGMKSRSEWSAALYGRVLGFRNFIRDAELDRIEELVEGNPSYFYNVLPYAYVFGMTKKWASKFESIPVERPSWYSPYNTAEDAYFDVVMMDSMLNHVSTGVTDVIQESIAKSTDSGSSGGGVFSSDSGGGFSGGGFGGGGGGAW